MSVLLRGGRVVTALSPARIVDADVLIDGDRVVSVGGAPSNATTRIDCSGCLVIPGNVCAHTHVYSALARGMPYALEPPHDFVEILQRVWWRLDRALDEGSVRASALVGAMEALLAGTTTLIDHHASPNAIDGSLGVVADAFQSLGLRSVVCYEVSDRDGPERARAGVEENRRFLTGKHGPLVRGMVGAHASFTLSDETLASCVEVSRATGAGIHVHAAEDAADELDSQARFGKSVAERLRDAGALKANALLAHCVHLDENECKLVREAGTTVAHNARSNMNNGVGRTPLAALGAVAVGTDGIGADMFEESRIGFFRLREDTLEAPYDWPLARLAEGARLAGGIFGEPALGTIEPGAPADVVVLDYEAPAPLDGANLVGHWVFGLGSRAVRDVIVAGVPVVRDRRLMKVDQQELSRKAVVDAKRLWERLEQIGPHPFEPKR
ncbi:MAG TPA: putative aminohydrolase SsnA [Candidatus Dormibacteraeota bacterium]|nr:putative aminohydrolase SsnA [Candidatus Dormibacteraeota bacterium]